jgi:hypothetical protein
MAWFKGQLKPEIMVLKWGSCKLSHHPIPGTKWGAILNSKNEELHIPNRRCVRLFAISKSLQKSELPIFHATNYTKKHGKKWLPKNPRETS